MKTKLSPEELQAVRLVQKSAGDTSQGLPEEVFELASSIVPMVNVDLFVQDEQGRILMIWREDSICGRGWHIPGGIIRFKELIEERIQKTAQNELGVQIHFEPKPMGINQFILPQDVRGHFISMLYRCFLPRNFPQLPEADPEKSYQPGEICWHRVSPSQWVKGQREVYETLFCSRNKCFTHHSIVEKLKTGECTFVFDIDGVVAEFDPTLKYDRAEPVKDIIAIINYLYFCGNKIVLFTARGSETGVDWSKITQEQMRNWGVKYHQLKFGKPAATFYVDDKNMSLSELYALAESIGVSKKK